MKKEFIIITSTIVIEVDREAYKCKTFEEAIKADLANVVANEVSITTGKGLVFDKQEQLDKVKQGFIKVLKEME